MRSSPPSPPHAPVRLVSVDTTHAAVLARLHAACFAGQPWHAAWNEATMATLLDMPGGNGWLALTGPETDAPETMEAPVGLLLVQAVAEDADILTLGVHPGPWRRRGIARSLLAQAGRTLIPIGVRRLILEVAENNTGAIAFYRAEGFAEIGRRRGYFTGDPKHPRDALVMARRWA